MSIKTFIAIIFTDYLCNSSRHLIRVAYCFQEKRLGGILEKPWWKLKTNLCAILTTLQRMAAPYPIWVNWDLTWSRESSGIYVVDVFVAVYITWLLMIPIVGGVAFDRIFVLAVAAVRCWCPSSFVVVVVVFTLIFWFVADALSLLISSKLSIHLVGCIDLTHLHNIVESRASKPAVATVICYFTFAWAPSALILHMRATS